MSAGIEQRPFWETKSLAEMNRQEWDALCDGCGRCCVEKLEDKKTGKVFFTNVACRYLDLETCRCKVYRNRKSAAPWCLILTPKLVPMIRWLPETCAYRIVHEQRKLQWWHPLLSKDPLTVHQAGISAVGKVISSEYVHPDDLANFIVDWRVWKDLGRALPKDRPEVVEK